MTTSNRLILFFGFLGSVAAVVIGFLSVPPAAAATVPGVPAYCSATDVTGLPGVVGNKVDVNWAAPDSDGGDAIFRYVVKIKGQATPVRQTDVDSDGYYNEPPKGGSARAWRWGDPYTSTTVFQIRAVNHVGFGAWCETPIAGSPPPPPPPPARPFIAYSSDAWLKQTTDGLTVNAAKTAAMRSYITTHDPHSEPNLAGVGGNAFGIGYAMSTCSDPVWTLSGGTLPSQWASLRTSGFHAPSDLPSRIPGGSDGAFVVIDRCNNFTVWASKATAANGVVTIVGGAAGAFVHTSNGLDRRATGSDSAVNERSRGVIPDSMVIRKDQLDYAVANNTDLGQRLEIFWWETDSSAGKISPPMAGFELGQAGWGAEGQLLGIDPSINLATRSCTPYALAIARTLQHYGTYIGDNAGGGGTSLKLEQDHGQWGTSIVQRELQGCITWNDFVAY